MTKEPRIVVETFTVSSNFETHRSGEKSSHFVSFGIRLDPPVLLDEISLIQLQAAHRVSVAAIHDALIRGALSLENANERIADIRHNYQTLKDHLEKKLTSDQNQENDERNNSSHSRHY